MYLFEQATLLTQLIFAMIAVLVLLVLWLLWRSRTPKIDYPPREMVELDTRLDKAMKELNETTNALQEARRAQALAEQRAALVSVRDEELARRNDDIQQLGNENTELKVRMELERKNAAEKIELLERARESMSTEFENVAQRILDEKGGKLAEQSRTDIDSVLAPLRQQIDGFRKKVEDVYDKESKDRTALHLEIGKLHEINKRISQDAHSLSSALKGDSKAHGNWGEMVLERVLEVSGLRRGHEYNVQQSFYNDEGSRMHPDVVLHLPEGKDIVIDSKLSLSAYEQYCNASGREERDAAMKQHVDAMQDHLRELGNKNYSELKGLRTLDFVFMFVPVEAAFISAMESDQRLFQDAYQRKIIIVSPSTLLAVLRTVANIWRTEHQSSNAIDIARKAGAMYDKFVKFISSLEEVGVRLDKARRAYDGAHKRLASGTGSLVLRAEELKIMGATTGKSLPPEMVDNAEIGNAIAVEHEEYEGHKEEKDGVSILPTADDGIVTAVETPR